MRFTSNVVAIQPLTMEKTDTQVVETFSDGLFSGCQKASRLQKAMEVLPWDTCHTEEP